MPQTTKSPAAAAKKPDVTLRAQIDALKTLRDELRVQAHLGGIEAKEAWKNIEPAFESLMKEAVSVGVITVNAVNGVFKEMKQVVAAIQAEAKAETAKRNAHP